MQSGNTHRVSANEVFWLEMSNRISPRECCSKGKEVSVRFDLLQRESDFMETSAIASRLQVSGEVPVTELSATAVLRLISIGSSLI